MHYEEEEIIDTPNEVKSIDSKLKADCKKYLIRIIWLIVINIIIFVMLEPSIYKLLMALALFVIGFNVVGFILGALVSALSYNNLSYGKKYLRQSLLTIYIIQATMTFIFIIFTIMRITGKM